MRNMIGWAIQAVAWTVIVAVFLALAVAVLVPRLTGATPYAVMTGSMRPSLPPGTLVVVKPRPIGEIQVGDVVTYQLESGRPEVVTHRVVGLGVRGDGGTVLTTRGDANNVVDADPVREVQIRGVAWYSVPWLGHVNHLLTGSQRQLAVHGVAAGLLLYAAHMFASSLKDRPSARRKEAPS